MSAHSVSKPSWEIVSPLEFIKGYIACAICGHRELFRASCPQEILDRLSKHVLEHFDPISFSGSTTIQENAE